MATGDGRPWETAGMSAGPAAGDGYRASSLPYLDPLKASRTTWNFNLGEYRFLTMTDASCCSSLGRSVH